MDPILPTDTFSIWLEKTNAFIAEANTFSPISNTLTLSGSNQVVNGTNRFASGIIFGSDGGPTVSASLDNLSLTISHNLSVLNGKGISANGLNITSGEVILNGVTYVFPSTSEISEGYLKTNHVTGNRYDVDVVTTNQIANDVLSSLTGGLTIAEELVPVGAIIGFRSVSTDISDENLWLKCDGSPITHEDYPELYEALGGVSPYTAPINLPDLNDNKSLIGTDDASGALLGTINTSSGTSYLPVVYYIKARSSELVNFAFTKNASATGIKFLNNLTNADLGQTADLSTGGAKLVLDVDPLYFEYSGNTLSLKASENGGANTLALRDSTGVLRSGPYDSLNPNANIVANVGYVNALGSREHKFKGINSKGFNSYSIAPSQGAVCLDIEDNVYCYGNNTNLSNNYRFGTYSGNAAYGHSLNAAGPAVAVYADDTNTYVKYQDNRVYSTGNNGSGKAGVLPTTNSLVGPTLAFGGLSISEVILSYDSKAETVYALTTEGGIKTYGSDQYGQLGNADSNGKIYGYNVTKAWIIGGGNTQTGYALRTDKTLWACGYGARGQMGRYTTTPSNSSWVPVLNPTAKTWAEVGVSGGTPMTDLTPASGDHNGQRVYKIAIASTLQTYDRIKVGTTYYTVNVIDTSTLPVGDQSGSHKFFKIYSADNIQSGVVNNVTSTTLLTGTVYVKMTDVVDAYFGGSGSNTFGFVHRKQYSGSTEILNILYGWGYNGFRQLGLGNDGSNVTSPTVIPTGGTSIETVYTGLDNTVHLVDNSGKLWGAGDNSKGIVGISNQTGNINAFTRFSGEMISTSGLPNPINYTVHKFFSSGNDTRFCVFKSLVPGTTDQYNYKLSGWGSGVNGRLGVMNNQNSYNSPQPIEVRNPRLIYDIQTSTVSDSSAMTLLLQRDDSLDYGDLYTCGRIYYNFNSFPSAEVIPYFTKVKNV